MIWKVLHYKCRLCTLSFPSPSLMVFQLQSILFIISNFVTLENSVCSNLVLLPQTTFLIRSCFLWWIISIPAFIDNCWESIMSHLIGNCAILNSGYLFTWEYIEYLRDCLDWNVINHFVCSYNIICLYLIFFINLC